MNIWLILLLVLIGIYVLMRVVASIKTEGPRIDDRNPYLNTASLSDLPAEMQPFAGNMPQKPERTPGFYERFCKPVLAHVISFFGLLFLSPLFLFLSLWIVIDDPGPVFFTQKRIGKGKTLFCLHKFRSMKMSTPHDMPTHMLADPDQYITRVGRFLRKSSLDEIPQIWDIFRGRMSVVGPRPALWNQADLVAEREKYGANDLMPGLTGWAQIHGRDELEIPDKARLDGEYCEKLSFAIDVRCFFGTIRSVLKRDGVVEGGTGELHKSQTKNQ